MTSITGQAAPIETAFDRIHADTLRFFPELVRDLGGDPDRLIRHAGLDPQLLELGCLDFGMRPAVAL